MSTPSAHHVISSSEFWSALVRRGTAALSLRTGPPPPSDPLKDADRDDRDHGDQEEEGKGA